MLRPRVRELSPCGQLTRGLVRWRNTRPAPPGRRAHPASELSGHGGESTLYGKLLYFVLHLFQIVFLNVTVFSIVMTCEGVSSYVSPFRAQAERRSHELLRTSAPGLWVCGYGSAAPSWDKLYTRHKAGTVPGFCRGPQYLENLPCGGAGIICLPQAGCLLREKMQRRLSCARLAPFPDLLVRSVTCPHLRRKGPAAPLI